MDIGKIADMVDLLHINDFKIGWWVKVINKDSPRLLSEGSVVEYSDGWFRVKFGEELEWLRWNQIVRTYEPQEDLFEDIGSVNWYPVEKEKE